MNRFLYLTSLLILLQAQPAFAQTVFVEQNGRLIVEVESVPAVSNWMNTIEFPDYTGHSAYLWTGSGTTGARNADPGALTYHFTINTPGNYEFRWRSRIGEGTNGTEANDSWVRFPTGSNIDGEHPLNGWTKGFMNQIGAWSWRTVTVDFVGESIRQHFSAGDHVLQISGRSHGHVVDRFTLFKYDTVNFNDGVFTNAPQSPHTGDEIEVIILEPEPEPEPTPEPEPEPEPAPDQNNDQNAVTDTSVVNVVPVVEPVQPLQIPSNQLNANECSGGVISLRPISDITIDSNEIKSSGELLTDSINRLVWLQFDLSSVPATANSTALTFTVGADEGQGTVVLSAGSHSDWNETDASLLPDISHLIGTFNGTWSGQKRYGFSFDPALIGNESISLAMEMVQGSDGIAIIPSVSEQEPRLQVTGSGDFCADYEANLASLDSEIKTDTIPVVEADNDGGGSVPFMDLLLLALTLTALAVRNIRLIDIISTNRHVEKN